MASSSPAETQNMSFALGKRDKIAAQISDGTYRKCCSGDNCTKPTRVRMPRVQKVPTG
jgi:hypothetical protein